ncbi:hypothetical protein B9Z55_017265 [Caenorhabditis nigoni]|uniref:T20D4.11-like domain-containing protein n=1 Tax=Caenorhabditis nigoni TaxID=1611254 RepID=A0A2G5T8M4_9PELO|nr:hypothetical protein B9Z55_017265 [Caenorhabditis nigoni]
MYFFELISYFLLLNFIHSLPVQNSTNGDVSACLKAFYKAAYRGEYNCTESFDFFQVVPAFQQAGFTSHKSCFLEVAKEECSIAQYNLLSTKYQDFLNVLTTVPPSVTPCSDSYFKYNALKCGPMMDELSHRTIDINSVAAKINDTKILEMIELCDKIEACISPVCYSSENQRKSLQEISNGVKLRNTEFAVCISKIERQSPDLSEYTCLDGIDFNTDDRKMQIELYTVKKVCAKRIMKDFCGERAVENFENDVETCLKNLMKLYKTARAGFHGGPGGFHGGPGGFRGPGGWNNGPGGRGRVGGSNGGGFLRHLWVHGFMGSWVRGFMG